MKISSKPEFPNFSRHSLFISLAAIVLAVVFIALPARAAEQPSRIRLLDGGRDGQDYLAALEISLAPGYLTYWRTPGDAGIAPTLDWSSSGNIADIAVSWPAPTRLLEADSTVYGFHGQVILPIRITPKTAGEKVVFKLAIQYGVCKDICIPVDATTEISLKGQGDDAVIVQRALRNLPKPTPPGADDPLAILGIESSKDEAGIVVTIRSPADEKAELFVEGPEGWLYSTSEASPGPQPGTSRFTVKLEDAPSKPTPPVSVRVTARSGTHSIETFMQFP